MFYAAVMTLWLVALVGFLNISCVQGIVNVMSLVITAAPSLLILRSVEAIIIAQWAQRSGKCEITVPVCILEGADNRKSRIRGYCTDLQNYQDF